MFRRTDPITERLRRLDLPRSAADRLVRQGTLVRIPSGKAICTKGQRGREAFLIVDGTANVLTDDGVVTAGPGDVVGELATLDWGRTRNATVVADGDVDVLVYDARAFLVLAEDPELRPRLVPDRLSA
ncbi:MAG TPA: cyclic nucleotide-binding domain-containing protein [Aquihabitans sp.]|jgi:CRP-like cAMP-binding protein|nr:cyclic nucleotide-binding domain-containing protein [Aquihabitans sp.]